MFEEREVHGQRLADDLTTNAVGELELNQLLDKPARVIEHGVEQEKTQFEDQVDKNRLDLFGITAPLDRGHHSIHDELAHPGLRRRQERPTQGEEAQADGGPGVGLPYELHGPGSVSEGAADFLPLLQQGGHRAGLLKGNEIVEEWSRAGGRAKCRPAAYLLNSG